MEQEDLIFENHAVELLFEKLCKQIRLMKTVSRVQFDFRSCLPENGFVTTKTINEIRNTYKAIILKETNTVLVPLYDISMF